MNHIYKTLWNDSSGAWVAVAENAGSQGSTTSSGAKSAAPLRSFAATALSACLMLAFGGAAHALPTGGAVAAGSATVGTTGSTMTINQSTASAVINWQSFGIGAGQTVQFVQPGSNSVALNRVLGTDASSILGNLSANGKVFLLNPNGVLFGSGAQVNVGGLVATTMSLSDAKFMTGDYSFSNAGSGSVVNQGTINAADGGYVALMGNTVLNQGVITARLGTVVLAGGQAATLDLAGDGMLNVAVTQGAVNALVDNGGMIRADGGKVLMTTQAAGSLLHTAVNNTGVVQAQTIGSRNGTILLLGDMTTGTMDVGGTLDASAPNGGNGGFIETSAAHVKVQDGVRVTTAAAQGSTGTWLIDPADFTIQAGFDISGATLSAQLVDNNVIIRSAAGGSEGNGDIFVNESVVWNGALGISNAPTTLTLEALRDVNIGRNSQGNVIPGVEITATNGNLVVCCGRDINVHAPITTTNGSILLSAGRDVNKSAAMTATNGNIMMCAANNLNLAGALTLTNGTLDTTRSLGLPRGLTLSADTDGTGPGVAGGTVIFDSLAPPWAVTNAPVTVTYNPVSYTTPTDFLTKFTLTAGAALDQRMLVFPEVTKTYDGTTTATLVSLKGNPADVSLVADPGSTAVFSSADPGTGKTVTFTGYRLTGPNAARYALATSCCGPIVSKTSGTITANAAFLLASGQGNPGALPAFLGVFLAGPQYGGNVMPTGYADTGDVFLALAEEEVVPAATLLSPQPPYIAPRYAPRAFRN